ncbi:acetyl-CoA C-acetyltransferase [Pacificibacter maritimus]|uniref:Acetyl-CoA C-acetyltransferase n=1 Tax=Pacificibacter maritimus TaxID=762213 RepID=A0A3N4UDI3_9RHOB|nr:thiolase family protein [Pacificibacter maritimus]RPE63337.1 acetyl-CoA C-acetyltransferase [Pacificibacter maritimus]
MSSAYIIAAKRSAVSPRNGAFATLSLHQLSTPVILDLLQTADISPDRVDEVIVSNALGAGGNPARHVALAAGLKQTVAGLTIDRQCCGGMDAVLLADSLVRSGRAKIVIAGGVESYSRAPLRAETFADGRPPLPYSQARFTPWADRDPMMQDAAATLARVTEISRADQDAWAALSHQKARAAKHRMAHEITQINDLSYDPFARNMTPALAARAKPLAGSITAANTSVAADASAFCLVVSDDIARRFIGPKAEIINGCTLGGEPDMPGIAPVEAIETTLYNANLGAEQLKACEIMEAYAVQAMACVQQAGLDPDIVNMGGGSLARGHPIGASGAINIVRLLSELSHTGGYGLGAIAAAGGLGTAVLLRV